MNMVILLPLKNLETAKVCPQFHQDQNDQEGRSSSLRVPSNEEDRQLVGDDFLDQTIGVKFLRSI